MFFYAARKVVVPVWSFFVNAGYWLAHIKDFNNAVKAKHKLKIQTLADVETLLKRFVWKEDSLIDWRPWVVTMFNRDLRDDCDGAAVLGKWALGKIGINSQIVELWNNKDKIGHAVCVSTDGRIMISNENVVVFPNTNWKNNVLLWHRGAFNIIA